MADGELGGLTELFQAGPKLATLLKVDVALTPDVCDRAFRATPGTGRASRPGPGRNRIAGIRAVPTRRSGAI